MKCSKCGQELPEWKFHQDRRSKTGFRSDCIDCHRKDALLSARKYYEKNKEVIKAKAREKYHNSGKIPVDVNQSIG
jgi:hypothetical protein